MIRDAVIKHASEPNWDAYLHSGGQTAFCELMVKARKVAGLTQRVQADRLRKPQSFVAKHEGR